jgi:hypothetical protein
MKWLEQVTFVDFMHTLWFFLGNDGDSWKGDDLVLPSIYQASFK